MNGTPHTPNAPRADLVDKFLAFGLMPPREHVPMEAVFSYLDLITEDELQGLTRFVESVAAYRRGETVLVDPRDPLEPS